ncbi:hypothetical protein LEG21_17560 [Salmonella enterica]|nr:hypothetical protein [Salmonella enterica subsp. enterica serovar Java]MDJ7310516.1 hypothetical protein [Salmonella enterica]
MSITSLIGEVNHLDEYSGFLQNIYLSGGRRPGVSGWMRRTLHQLVYCTVGPVPLDSLICQFGPRECSKSSGTSLPCGFRTSPAGDSGGKIA